jgi:nucleotide-binding universal stress UspA family protein
MLHIQRILCPVDLSEPSRHALDHAVVLAGWYSASITVLHVYTPLFLPVPGPMMNGFDAQTMVDVADTASLTERVNAFVATAMTEDLRHDVVIDSGAPAARIVSHAAVLPADIIVMGTHGASGFEHFMVGSITEKVLRKATCPVLTVPPAVAGSPRLPFKRLLCAIDFSDASLDALASAFELAREADAHIALVHVLEGPEDDEPVTIRSFNVPEYRRLREEDAGIKLSSLVPADARRFCEPALLLSHGKPYREILRLAEKERADLIVMGVHGRNPVDVALFGSTTNQVVRQAKTPVLTMRARVDRRRDREWRERPELVAMPT